MEGGEELEGSDPPRLTRAEGRKFGLTVGIAFLALGGVLLWRGHDAAAYGAAAAGGLLAAAGLLVPARLGPVRRLWMRMAEAVSKITLPFLMGAVFYLVLTPVGLLMRLFGRDPMERDDEARSVWKRREEVGGRGGMENQF